MPTVWVCLMFELKHALSVAQLCAHLSTRIVSMHSYESHKGMPSRAAQHRRGHLEITGYVPALVEGADPPSVWDRTEYAHKV